MFCKGFYSTMKTFSNLDKSFYILINSYIEAVLDLHFFYEGTLTRPPESKNVFNSEKHNLNVTSPPRPQKEKKITK